MPGTPHAAHREHPGDICRASRHREHPGDTASAGRLPNARNATFQMLIVSGTGTLIFEVSR
jgi:hypothetical protein